jgi:low affinity Fe/Cu permease
VPAEHRDITAQHLKLDELIRVSNKLLDLEDMTEDERERLRVHFVSLADKPTETALLQEAKEDLAACGGYIRQDGEKRSTLAAGKRVVNNRSLRGLPIQER